MQEDIGRLAAQNALLEARLREALSVQPAAIDPRELARADEKIKALQKERDLLAVSLQQTGPQTGSPVAGRAHVRCPLLLPNQAPTQPDNP